MPAIGARRSNISDELRQAIRRRIVDGSLPAGERINEVHLSRQLEVSRTPLREALSQLAAEGFVDSLPRRGFFTRGLSVDEVRQLYPLRAFLDPQALEMAGAPDSERIAELRQLNARIAAAGTRPARAIDLDDQWHRLLLRDCPNRILLDIIDQLIWKSRRYEFAYLKQTHNLQVATAEHDAILDALDDDDLPKACDMLRQNMSSAREPLIQWLNARENTA